MTVYDCIVVGLGGIGSAALHAAAIRGWDVLGLEQFGIANDRGSSHGQTRIIRTAYFEHPNYVPLARQAFSRWAAIQSQTDRELIKRIGLLQIGTPDSEVIRGTIASADEFELEIDRLDAVQIGKQFPAIRVGDHQVGLYERQAGYLRVERCAAVQVQMAREAGATVATSCEVKSWEARDDGTVVVRSQNETFATRRLIVTAGAWARSLLGQSCGETQVLRKQQHWFQLDRIDIKAQNGFPAFLLETERGVFYGLPEIDHLGLKVAEHTGGQAVSGSPSLLDRTENQEDRGKVEWFLNQHFQFSRCRLVHSSPCMYTMSPDGHFFVDQVPALPQVVFAAGLSGHGFKFSPVLGDYLVKMLDGHRDPLFDFLKIDNRRTD